MTHKLYVTYSGFGAATLIIMLFCMTVLMSPSVLAFSPNAITQTSQSRESSSQDEQEIEDDQSQVNQPTEIVDDNEEAGFLAGIAWYWWPVAAIAIATALWLLIATLRRRSA